LVGILDSIQKQTVPTNTTQDVSGTVALSSQQAADLHQLNIDATFVTSVFFPACVIVLLLWYVVSRFWDMR
jgi:hypothetical protein